MSPLPSISGVACRFGVVGGFRRRSETASLGCHPSLPAGETASMLMASGATPAAVAASTRIPKIKSPNSKGLVRRCGENGDGAALTRCCLSPCSSSLSFFAVEASNLDGGSNPSNSISLEPFEPFLCLMFL